MRKKIFLLGLLVLSIIFISLPLAAQMTFDGSGNVGIGTDTPGSKLDVSGTVNMTTLSLGSTPITASAVELNYVDGVTSSIQSQLDGKASSSNPNFTGKVGIGTSSPAEQLTLAGGNFLQSSGNPVHAGAITDTGTTALSGACSIYVVGRYAYVASEADNGVEILDISDPANPTHVGAITDTGATALEGANSIYVSGKYAYVASGQDSGVEILDISDPATPTHVGAIFDDNTTALKGACSIYISGKYAYVTSEGSWGHGGVEILDISFPAAPTHVGLINDDDTTALYGAKSIYVSGKYAYVASDNDDGVEILDISDPENPTHVGVITDTGTTALDGAHSIDVSGKYAYVASVSDSGVEILDISDPATPTHVGAITDDYATELDGAISIYVSGKYAYIASVSDDGVEILDISDPVNPTHVGAITDAGATALAGAKSIYVVGKYAYVASCSDDGVEILEITGIDVPAADIGALAAGSLDVSADTCIANNLSVNGGLNVGVGGLKTDGPVSIFADVDSDGDQGIFTISSTTQKMVFDGNEIDTPWYNTEIHLNHNCDKNIYLVDGGGKVGIGTGFATLSYALEVGTAGDGSEARANAWNTFSDRRLKEKITRISDPLSLLEKINGVYFYWKQGDDKSRQVGVIAQEVEKVLPEIVSTGQDGYKAVDYGKLSPLLIEAVKEIKKQQEIRQQENRQMKQDIQELKEALCM